jgi:hypothetical protein
MATSVARKLSDGSGFVSGETRPRLRWPRQKAGRECLDRWSASGGPGRGGLHMGEASEGPLFGER